MIFRKEGNALTARRGGETLRIEGWGENALRVRAVMYDTWTGRDYALTEKPAAADCEIRIGTEDNPDGSGSVPCAEIRNGRISATVNFAGVISFYRDGKLIYEGTVHGHTYVHDEEQMNMLYLGYSGL